jgi:hypothetical protein
VHLLGRVEGDPRVLATVRDGDPVRVELVDDRWSPPDAARTTGGNA